MTERPIIFSGSMVRALLDGSKTMTRRVLKPQPQRFRLTADDPYYGLERGDLCPVMAFQAEDEDCPRVALGRVITKQKVPFAVGNLLWVREAFAQPNDQVTIYRANWREDAIARGLEGVPETNANIRWRPSIHMPRAVSRITLEVTAVKIEPLHDITEADARAEGAIRYVPTQSSVSGRSLPASEMFCFSVDPITGERLADAMTARQSFELLWDSLHGAGAWDSNPHIVAISFKRIMP